MPSLGPKRFAVSLIKSTANKARFSTPKNRFYSLTNLTKQGFQQSSRKPGQSRFPPLKQKSFAKQRLSVSLQKRSFQTNRYLFKQPELSEEEKRERANASAHETQTVSEIGQDPHYKPLGGGDPRVFYYFVATGSKAAFATAARLAVLKFIYSWSASAKMLALATVEVDLTPIPRGKTVVVTWRGKPVFIKHRTLDEIAILQSEPIYSLRDPESDAERTKDENWTVCLAVCTHLGCVPVIDAGGWNAFFCPCHGSHYDAAGRIRQGPAPRNLELVDPTVFKGSYGSQTLVLG